MTTAKNDVFFEGGGGGVGGITKKSLLVWGMKLWWGKQNLVGESTFYKINHFCPLSSLPSNIISEKPNEKL